MTDFLPTSLSLVFPLGAGVLLVLALLSVGKVPLTYNLRNLLVRWKTSLVTALAFTLVIALLVVMLAFVTGMNRLTEQTGQPANVMILSDGATDEVFSNLPPGVSVLSLPSEVQKQVARDAQGNFLVSQEVYVIVNQPLPHPTAAGAKRRFVQMRGIADAAIAARVHDLELLSGRWFSSGGSYEVVLGEGVARVLGDDRDEGPIQPGTVLEIGPRQWTVVGIMKSSGTTFGSEIWARDTYIGETFGKQNSYSVYVARAKDPAAAQVAAEALKKASQAGGGTALQAVPEPEYYARLGETNQQFLVAILFVAIVLAVGGVLGVMNTMFAAISQRSGDIGVLRLLGFTRWQILVSFLLESLLLALVGGLLGCALGYLADGFSATSIASSGSGGGKTIMLRLTVDGNTLAVGLIFTLVMGLLGGLVPSLSAMRLRPLESLR